MTDKQESSSTQDVSANDPRPETDGSGAAANGEGYPSPDVDLTDEDDTQTPGSGSSGPDPRGESAQDPGADEDLSDSDEQSVSEEELREMGRDVAVSEVQSASGDSKDEQIANAIGSLQSKFQSLKQQLQSVREGTAHWSDQVESAEAAINHLENIGDDPDRSVTRELHDGVIVDVPPEEREDFIDDIREERSEAEENLDTLEERTQDIAQGLSKAQVAIEELQETQEQRQSVAEKEDRLGLTDTEQ